MFFETRLSRYFTQIFNDSKKKVLIVQSSFSLVIFSLFFGFLIGNLFGTFLDTLRLYFLWNGFVGLFLLLLIEAINSLVYGISFSKKFDDLDYANNKKGDWFLSSASNFAGIQSMRWTFDKVDRVKDRKTGFLQKLNLSKTLEKFMNFIENVGLFSFNLSPNYPTVGQLPKKGFKPNTSAVISFFKFFKNIIHMERTLNSFKIGLLFGFFVDSFKVGS